MCPEKIGRREFMVKSASGLAGLALSATARGSSTRVLGANDRLSIGVIGTGGRGQLLMGEVQRFSDELNAEITALCDVWRLNLTRAAVTVRRWHSRQPRTFVDYEDLLALDDVDAVIIATPDFHHARMVEKAARAGKDAYVEKPMATDLEDAKNAVRAVEESGSVVQVGTQRRSDGRFRAGAELFRSDPLGKISRAEAAWNDCAPRWRRDVSNVKEEDIDWRRYLGRLKYRPFDPHQFREWHLYRDFTNGTIGLLGSHMIDVVHWFMDDPLPISAVAQGGNFAWDDGREHEDTVYALLEYPTAFVLRYCSGLGNSLGNGCYFYGTKGSFDTSTWKATGAGGRRDKIEEDIIIEAQPSENHVKNWLECVRSRKTPSASVHAGYGHSVAAIIGERALRTGRRVAYDVRNKEMQGG